MPRKNNKNKSQNKNKNKNNQLIIHIPRFQANIRFARRYRFQVLTGSGNFGKSITRGMLLNLLAVADSNLTNLWRVVNSVKLRRIEIWGGQEASIAPDTVSIIWLSNLAPSTQISDSGNAFQIAHIATSPPKQSLAGFWSTSGSNEGEYLFRLVLPPSAIVDIWTENVLFNGEPSVSLGFTGTISAGQLYVRGLDNSSLTAQLLPIDYVTI